MYSQWDALWYVLVMKAELYLMDALFKGNSDQDQLNKILAILGTPPSSWDAGYKLAKKVGIQFGQYSKVGLDSIIRSASSDAIDLMEQMLQYDPVKRPSASQILQHPYFMKTMKVDPAHQVWGETSVRDNYTKKKSLINAQTKYENPRNQVVNMQNYASKNKLDELDNDWDEDFEILIKPRGDGTNRSIGNKYGNNPNENSMLDQSRGLMPNKSGAYLQNSAYNMKNDVKPAGGKNTWEEEKLDESLEGDFDVFDKGKEKKGGVQVNNFGNKIFGDDKAKTKKQAFDIAEWGDEF